MASVLDRQVCIIDDELCNNFAVLVTALRFTLTGLEDIVQLSIKDLHRKISNKCKGCLPCTDDCMNVHNKNYNRWCYTCIKWKEELAKFMRVPGKINYVQWEKFDSKYWSQIDKLQAVNQVANVFVHNCKDPMKSVVVDILDIVSLFENCSYFTIGQNKELLSNVRKVRNSYFAHNPSKFTIDEEELVYCLNVLLEFLGDISLTNDKKCKEMRRHIYDLKDKDKRKKSDEVSENALVIRNLLHQNSNETELDFLALISKKQDINHRRQRHRRYDWILLFFFVCWFQYRMQLGDNDYLQERECKTMDFQFPWKSDLSFKPYIDDSNDFVGREWMIEDLSYELIDSSRRGILVAAEMGFGKTALISHIACSRNKGLPGFPIFEKIASIHLCRYYSNLTLNPGIFVRNMAGKLSSLYPEINNFINTDSTASSYLSSSKCIEDPSGCFDYTVLQPLKLTNIGQNTLMITIIDALDECIEYGSNNILSLLYEKIYKLPPKIKFLFTSRNISGVRTNLPSGISVYQTPLFLKNNLQDINKYLTKKLGNKTIKEQFESMLCSSSSCDVSGKLADLVGGNFLFLIHAFDAWVQLGNVKDFPSDIENVYRSNVKRIFGKKENLFSNVRSILEVLCASQGSINEILLLNVLNIVEPQQKIFFSRLLSNELSHFVQKSSGRIVFTNRRLADFFARQDNVENDFYILQQNGHEMLAQYWVRHLENYQDKTIPLFVIDVFQHVSTSRNQSLNNRLIEAVRNRLNRTSLAILKHYIAASLNSYVAMLLAIESAPEIEIDKRDPHNLTASFIAAAYGKDKSLAALIQKGADINFERSQPVLSLILPSQDPINLSKYTFQWGYNLANIAAQNGHDRVMKLLLKHNINICHENAVGLNSFHLAAEHGHTSILRILMSTSKCNWNLSFQTSLYLAAKNGHLSVVKYLLSLNAVDRCVPCLDTINWIPKGKIRLQSNIPFQKLPERDYRNFVLKEDRRLFLCESALDIAVQNRHLEIVKVLTRETVNAIKCVNARGMTPLITAAAFESHDIVQYFLQTGLSVNDTCKEMKNMETRIYYKNAHSAEERVCVKGLSFWHMLAVYASAKTIEFVHTLKKYDYIWDIIDDNGATPLHYACCNGRLTDDKINVRQFDALASHLQDRTYNGSTPAHSAALCGKYFPIHLFVNYHRLPSDIKDNSNKNILHYFAMSNLIYISTNDLQTIYTTSYDKLISEQDIDGRTPLHYAAEAGKLFLTSKSQHWIIAHNPHHFEIKDKSNVTVLGSLFKSMPAFQPKHGRSILVLPYNCFSDDLFSIPGCSDIRFNLLDDYEVFAFQAFTNMKNTSFVQEESISTFMRVSLIKNRFYLIYMMKVLFPNLYHSISQKHVHWFLSQLLKKSLHPNLILSSTFVIDLIKYSCESKKHDGSLWYIFYDKERKFWPMYLIWNGTKFIDVVSSVLTKCNQRGIINAVVKGGNLIVLDRSNFQSCFDIDADLEIKKIPCINAQSQYLMPKILYQENKYEYYGVNRMPYSHRQIWMRYILQISFMDTCDKTTTELSLEHIAAAKGVTSLFWNKAEYHLPCGTNEHYIRPHMLAYFFNHPWPFEKYVNINNFFKNHFVSLFFKITMDFHTFVFPKNSAAWRCHGYIHQSSRMTLQKLICRANLEKEICSLISRLYSINWRLVYHIYTFKNINKFKDYKSKHSFDFIGFIQHVRTRCQSRRTGHLFLQADAYQKAQIYAYKSCSKPSEFKSSRYCLMKISFVNKQRKYINYQIQSILLMYFPLTYMIYHEFIIELPDLAKKNTMQIVQIMHAYGSAPFFHNNPLYDYWYALDSSFSNPFRTMTQTILSSEVSEIKSWIQDPKLENIALSRNKQVENEMLHYDPLSYYENLNLTENDSTE